jgi:catechol 2,3-dioxygenase-like lactoylglutathione lyase family enzyme
MIRVGSIVIRVDDLERQTEFWRAALDYEPRQGDDDDFVLLRPKDGVGRTFPSTGFARPSRCRRASTWTCTPTIRPGRSNG